MGLTSKQAHVLDNINRVVPLASNAAHERYQLDGVECTVEINDLASNRLISVHPDDGMFKRLKGPRIDNGTRVGERQKPLTGSMDAIRALLSSPRDVRVRKKSRGGSRSASAGGTHS